MSPESRATSHAPDMTFTPDSLLDTLNSPASTAGFRVAYSGGLDSHVLLHALVRLRDRLSVPIGAVHVNHGLSPKAGAWARHCRRVCDDLSVELTCVGIDAAAPAGESQEAWSRKRRYEVLGELMEKNEVLLTAHQADDQAETLLLQLLRGSGPDGLAAMPVISEFAGGWHARPLLGFDRPALFEYAQACGLQWLEDESNRDQRFDRNFLRNSVLSVLRQRWPSVSRTLGRSARIQAETAVLLAQLADMDMESCYEPLSGTLNVAVAMTLPTARRRNLVRQWLRRQGFSMPDSRRLEVIINEVFPAREDAQPSVQWDGVEVRRFRGRLFAITPLPPASVSDRIPWDMSEPLRLPLGELSSEMKIGTGIRAEACLEGRILVGFRSGGEVIRRSGRDCHQELKKLFQEHSVPPWLRSYIPLVFIESELASVAGVWTADEYSAAPEEDGFHIHWTESDRVFDQS